MARTRNLGNLTDLLTAGSSFVTTTTPPQFDNGQNLSTTGFVQAALGNFSDQVVVGTTPVTMDATYIGKFVLFTAAGAQTATLPLTTSFPNGACITVHNTTTSVNKTINSQGADVISPTGNSLTTITLGPGDSMTFVKTGSSVWRALGVGVLSYSGGFGISPLSTAGYQKLPSGLIIQWGNGNYSAQTTTTSNFTIAFPNNCLATYASLGFNLSLTTNSVGVGIQAISTTQFKLTVPSAGAGSTGCSWLAIGT
jgi:hypothetical protein